MNTLNRRSALFVDFQLPVGCRSLMLIRHQTGIKYLTSILLFRYISPEIFIGDPLVGTIRFNLRKGGVNCLA